MFKKILYHLDKKHFGNQTLVYKGDYKQNVIYFVAITDRGEPAYYFVDSNLEKMWPVNSYIDRLGISIGFPNIRIDRSEISITFHNTQDCLDFDIDLSHYGYSHCSDFLVKLIQNNI